MFTYRQHKRSTGPIEIDVREMCMKTIQLTDEQIDLLREVLSSVQYGPGYSYESWLAVNALVTDIDKQINDESQRAKKYWDRVRDILRVVRDNPDDFEFNDHPDTSIRLERRVVKTVERIYLDGSVSTISSHREAMSRQSIELPLHRLKSQIEAMTDDD